MSKINVTFDTKSKALEVTVDGEAMANVYGIEFYNYSEDDSFACCISQRAEDADNKMVKYTRLVAKESKEGLAAVKAGLSLSSKWADFISLTDPKKLLSDIKSFFSNEN